VIGGFARRAAAPAAGVAANSPLGWLTTTGPLLPLRAGGETGLTAKTLDDLDRLAVRAVEILDRHGAGADQAARISAVPDFAFFAGIAGPPEIITLEVAS